MPQRAEEVAVVTGSSSGIGFETSHALARNGFHTYATMRKLDGGGSNQITDIAKNENLPLDVVQLDVDDDKSVLDAINKIVSEKDRIDVVVNNAGYTLIGTFEENSMEEIKAQFETNFFGAVRVMIAVIPTMRKQRSGKIVNISSMGGRISFPLDSIYHGTKFALEGLSESIQYELEPFGIKIIVIGQGGGFELYREMRRIDNKVKVCFLTAGEMYYGAYADIFNENQFIRKPIENKELINRVNEMINS